MAASEFRELCNSRGLAVTHQRVVIWEALSELPGHPSPEELFLAVRERIPSISLATVYKNLKTFIEHGLLAEVSLHHGSVRLETNSVPHHHLVCVRCRRIEDLPDDSLEPPKLRTDCPEGFRVQRFSVELLGLCRDCAPTN